MADPTLRLPPPLDDELDPLWPDDGVDEAIDRGICLLGTLAAVAWYGGCIATGLGLGLAVARRLWPS